VEAEKREHNFIIKMELTNVRKRPLARSKTEEREGNRRPKTQKEMVLKGKRKAIDHQSKYPKPGGGEGV